MKMIVKKVSQYTMCIVVWLWCVNDESAWYNTNEIVGEQPQPFPTGRSDEGEVCGWGEGCLLCLDASNIGCYKSYEVFLLNISLIFQVLVVLVLQVEGALHSGMWLFHKYLNTQILRKILCSGDGKHLCSLCEVFVLPCRHLPVGI